MISITSFIFGLFLGLWGGMKLSKWIILYKVRKEWTPADYDTLSIFLKDL